MLRSPFHVATFPRMRPVTVSSTPGIRRPLFPVGAVVIIQFCAATTPSPFSFMHDFVPRLPGLVAVRPVRRTGSATVPSTLGFRRRLLLPMGAMLLVRSRARAPPSSLPFRHGFITRLLIHIAACRVRRTGSATVSSMPRLGILLFSVVASSTPPVPAVVPRLLIYVAARAHRRVGSATVPRPGGPLLAVVAVVAPSILSPPPRTSSLPRPCPPLLPLQLRPLPLDLLRRARLGLQNSLVVIVRAPNDGRQKPLVRPRRIAFCSVPPPM
jgi:hypothetical protein